MTQPAPTTPSPGRPPSIGEATKRRELEESLSEARKRLVDYANQLDQLRTEVEFYRSKAGLAFAKLESREQALREKYPFYSQLPRTEKSVFGLLYDHKEKLVRKTQLMSYLYSTKPGAEPDPKILDVFICKIRREMKRGKEERIQISTEYGVGWVLCEFSKSPLRQDLPALSTIPLEAFSPSEKMIFLQLYKANGEIVSREDLMPRRKAYRPYDGLTSLVYKMNNKLAMQGQGLFIRYTRQLPFGYSLKRILIEGAKGNLSPKG